MLQSSGDLRKWFEEQAQIAELRVECPMWGSYLSEIVVVAEAPGNMEVTQQSPLVGASGRLLWNSVGKYANLKRLDCYITNVSKRQIAFEVDAARKPMSKHESTAWQELLKQELAKLPAGNVSDIKKRWNAIAGAAAAAAPVVPEDVTIQVNSAETIVGISGEPVPVEAATAVPDWAAGAPKNEIVQEESKL